MTLSQDDTAWATERGRSLAAALGQRSHPVHGDLADLHAAITDDPAEAGPVDDAAIAHPAVEMIAALLTNLRNARARIPDQDKQTKRRARAATRGSPGPDRG